MQKSLKSPHKGKNKNLLELINEFGKVAGQNQHTNGDLGPLLFVHHQKDNKYLLCTHSRSNTMPTMRERKIH